jgi:hypothetical protein
MGWWRAWAGGIRLGNPGLSARDRRGHTPEMPSPAARSSIRSALVLVALGLGAACDAGQLTTGNVPCTPLASEPAAPIALGTVLGIGRHADGTIYVLDDRGSSDYRAFVSSGTVLNRKRVSGSGSGQETGGAWYVASVPDPTAPFLLKVDNTTGSLRMGVLRGPITDRDFVIGDAGDVLDVLTADAIAGMTVLDLANDPQVDYLAHLPDGRMLLVIRPSVDASYEDFRVFVGTADQMVERRVTRVERARDGGSTWIDFALDGGQATAFFPSPLTGGDATLTTDGATLTLATEAAGTRPTDGAFVCL